jgi:hypothetical protein
MVYFQTKIQNLDIFWKALYVVKILIYFMALDILKVTWYKLSKFWHILWYLVHPPVLVCCTKRNLAILIQNPDCWHQNRLTRNINSTYNRFFDNWKLLVTAFGIDVFSFLFIGIF